MRKPKDDEKVALYVLLAIIACTVLFSVFVGWIPAHELVCQEAPKENPNCTYALFPFYLILHIFKFVTPYSEAITAAATGVIAIYTFTLWRATKRLWESGEQQIELVRSEFHSTHRPRLRVRNIVFDQTDESIDEATGISEIFGYVYVTNVGETEAKLADAGCWAELHRTLPMSPEHMERPPNILNKDIIAPGETIRFRFRKSYGSQGDGFGMALYIAMRKQSTDPTNLYVLGWIGYTDNLKILRATAFCRIFDKKIMRFKAVDDPDYEYED